MFMAYVPVMALLEHLKSLRTSPTLAKSLILSKVDYGDTVFYQPRTQAQITY